MSSDTTTKMQQSEAIQNFLTYKEINHNPSQRTLINYRHWLKRFYGWYGDKLVNDLTLDDIERYRFYLFGLKNEEGEKLLGIVTLNHHLVALRVLFQYCIGHGVKAPMPDMIKPAKEPGRIVEYLTKEEFVRMVEAIDGTGIRALRNKAIILMFYSTGLRVSELSSLNRDQIDLTRNEISIIGKGSKPGIVFLKDSAKEALVNYLSKRKDNFTALFLNYKTFRIFRDDPKKRRMHPAAIQRMIKSIAKKAGITKDVTPHTLRHTFGTHLSENGADIRVVQELMRHASIKTTMIYTHVSNPRLREVHDRYL